MANAPPGRGGFASGRCFVDTERAMKGSVAALALALSALLACEERSREGTGPVGSEQSPNASILPAPLAPGREARTDARPGSSASPTPTLPPRPFPNDRELPNEASLERDVGGVELRAEFVWPGVETREVTLPSKPDAAPPRLDSRADAGKSPEIKTLFTQPTLRIRLTTNGRMFAELSSPSFTLPAGTQLMARLDRFGHVVVWPDGRSYRVAPRGSLRALLQERRVDVAPLLDGEIVPGGAGKRFDLTTLRHTVQSPLGEVVMESAVDATLGGSGVLVCRLLLELLRLDPGVDLCPSGELPVEATFRWVNGGELAFRVTSLRRVASFATLGSDALSIPPAMPIFKPGELPPETSALLWSEAEERQLLGARSPREAELTLDNPSEVPVFVVADRTPVARVAQRSSTVFRAAQRSHIVFHRDFLGERVSTSQSLELPAKLVLGVSDIPAAEGTTETSAPAAKTADTAAEPRPAR